MEGCFHDAAAREYFSNEEIETIACTTFSSMAEKIAGQPHLLGIMAIENTIAGSLLQNHELIQRHRLRIIGEHKKRISHVLAALPGQSLEDIREVHSHPMALMQCEDFLRKHPEIKMVEHFDTAGSARDIAVGKIKGRGAICGDFAAARYGLDILEEGIETDKHNFTRFLILSSVSAGSAHPELSECDKASVAFTLPHTQGALSKVLAILAFYDLNLTKIQSFPIIGREWEYRFYVDIVFGDALRYRQGLDAVRPLTNALEIMGEYISCKSPGFD